MKKPYVFAIISLLVVAICVATISLYLILNPLASTAPALQPVGMPQPADTLQQNEKTTDCSPAAGENYFQPCPSGLVCLKGACADPQKTFKYAESDIPFAADCSQMDESGQERCERFVEYTEKVFYPILRELTGGSLSSCYERITYQFISGHRGHGVASRSGNIQFGEDFLNQDGDFHELFHVINYCSGALDIHLFHGAVEGLVGERVYERPVTSSEEALQGDLLKMESIMPGIREQIEENPASDYYNLFYKSAECSQVLQSLMFILIDQKGKEYVLGLYKEMAQLEVSIPPNHPLRETVAADPSMEADTARIIVLANRLRSELKPSPMTEEAFDILSSYCGLDTAPRDI